MARERGAILVFSLIALLVMTLLSVTLFTSSRLEQVMATSVDGSRRAFLAADGVLRKIGRDIDAFRMTETVETNPPGDIDGRISGLASFGGDVAGAVYDTWFIAEYPPPEGSGYSVRRFDAYHYGARAEGFSVSGAAGGVDPATSASVRIDGTFWLIAPKR